MYRVFKNETKNDIKYCHVVISPGDYCVTFKVGDREKFKILEETKDGTIEISPLYCVYRNEPIEDLIESCTEIPQTINDSSYGIITCTHDFEVRSRVYKAEKQLITPFCKDTYIVLENTNQRDIRVFKANEDVQYQGVQIHKGHYCVVYDKEKFRIVHLDQDIYLVSVQYSGEHIDKLIDLQRKCVEISQVINDSFSIGILKDEFKLGTAKGHYIPIDEANYHIVLENNSKVDTVTKDRAKNIGGSDIPAILELMTYKDQNMYDLYLAKKNGKVVEDRFGYMKIGTDNEPIITEAVNKHLGTNFKPKSYIVDKAVVKLQTFNYRGNVDGVDENLILEVKCRLKPRLTMYEILQTHFYALCLEIDKKKVEHIYIAVAKIHSSLPKIDDNIYLYKLDINKDLINYIKERVKVFDDLYTNVFNEDRQDLYMKDMVKIMEEYGICKLDHIQIKKEEDTKWQEYYQKMSQQYEVITLK